MRISGNSGFRKEAKRGDLVIDISRAKANGTPYGVYRHLPILHRQEEPNCTRFYVELFSNAEKTKLSWTAFKQLARRVGLPGKVGPNSCRVVSGDYSNALLALWDKAKE